MAQTFSHYVRLQYGAYVGNTVEQKLNGKVDFSEKCWRLLNDGQFHFKDWFEMEPLLKGEDGKSDYWGTCFYILNCLQEWVPNQADYLGRFKYECSFQHHFNCVYENLVNQYFDKILQELWAENVPTKLETPSRFFISHDNDVFFGSFLQDGLWALKKKRLDIVVKLIINEIIRKPHWLNLEQIMDINDEHGVKTTFFWLVNKGLAAPHLTSGKKLKNADYDYHNSRIQKLVKRVAERGFENGLHKSISNETFAEEANRLGFEPLANRNHFLKFSLPVHFHQLDAAGVKLDFSLGFAETFGFRNGYSLPFHPYNFEKNEPYQVLVIPQNIMDATAFSYLKISPKETQKQALALLENHKTGSLLSILWHNKYFTKYKYGGFLEVYKSILEFMNENGVKSISQTEILESYSFKNSR